MALVTKLRQHISSTRWVPWWWTGPNRGRVLFAIGAALDMAIEHVYMGIQERFPSFCSEEALTWLGRDRGLVRGPNESAESFRERLLRWRETWRLAGSAWAVLDQIQTFFIPDVTSVYLVSHDPVRDEATWWGILSDGTRTRHVQSPSNWDFDSDDAARPASLDTIDTRFWIIIEQRQGSVVPAYFAPRSSAQAVTSNLESANGVIHPDATDIHPSIWSDFYGFAKKWKQAGTWVAGIFVWFDTVDPTGSGANYPDANWHNPLNDTLDGTRYPEDLRILYMNRYAGDQLPASPEPWPV